MYYNKFKWIKINDGECVSFYSSETKNKKVVFLHKNTICISNNDEVYIPTSLEFSNKYVLEDKLKEIVEYAVLNGDDEKSIFLEDRALIYYREKEQYISFYNSHGVLVDFCGPWWTLGVCIL